MILIVGQSEPFRLVFDHRMELFDEFAILICGYHVILLSDFVPSTNSDFKSYVSLSSIIFISIVVLIHIGFLVFSVIRKILLYLRRKINTLIKKFRSKKEKEEEKK
jgi:hypothetical protein